MISVNGLVKTFPDRDREVRAIDELSFRIQDGEFYTLLGPSGCGKTTTLKCVAGLERPDQGEVQLGDTVVVSDRLFVPTHRRDIGMVFQSYAVWPHMDVFENVAFPLRVLTGTRSKSALAEKVSPILELVGLGGLEHRMATQLSGGQQQRLSLARALVREPRVLLLDEPLSNLDAKLRASMRSELTLIQRRLGITTLFVTHDQAEALAMSDRIAVMSRGRIVQEGPPREIYHEPVDEFVASFVGSTNLLRGDLVNADRWDEGKATIKTAIGEFAFHASSGAPTGQEFSIAIRPEDILVRPQTTGKAEYAENTVTGTIELAQFIGPSVEYRVVVAEDHIVTVHAPSRVNVPTGQNVTLEFPRAACRAIPTAPAVLKPLDTRDSREIATSAGVADDLGR